MTDKLSKTLEGSAGIEAQLDARAKSVQAVAASGKPNARTIVDAFARNGINISGGAKQVLSRSIIARLARLTIFDRFAGRSVFFPFEGHEA